MDRIFLAGVAQTKKSKTSIGLLHSHPIAYTQHVEKKRGWLLFSLGSQTRNLCWVRLLSFSTATTREAENGEAVGEEATQVNAKMCSRRFTLVLTFSNEGGLTSEKQMRKTSV